jgi:hypothetical protein
MEDFSEEFIRKVIMVASTKSSPLCKKAIVMLTLGDFVGLKELLPEVFE